MTTIHCRSLDTPSAIDGNTMNYSSAKQQAAEEEAMSLCRQDRHKNGGAPAFDNEVAKRQEHAPMPLFLVRH